MKNMDLKENVTHVEKYLASPEARKGRKYSGAFTRRRDGARSWEIIEKAPLSIIRRVIKGQKEKSKN